MLIGGLQQNGGVLCDQHGSSHDETRGSRRNRVKVAGSNAKLRRRRGALREGSQSFLINRAQENRAKARTKRGSLRMPRKFFLLYIAAIFPASTQSDSDASFLIFEAPIDLQTAVGVIRFSNVYYRRTSIGRAMILSRSRSLTRQARL